MTPLAPNQVEALHSLRAAYPDANIALIGAAALAHHIDLTWRNTADIDLLIAISVEDLGAKLSSLPGWTQDPKQQQRWSAPNGVQIDIVPAPAHALEGRVLVWEETDHTMSLEGARHALASPDKEIEPGLTIKIATLPVIVLLKMAAYLDRPIRDKDLVDLVYILSGYPPTGDDRFFSDDIMGRGLGEEQARGFILGSELRKIVDDREHAIVQRFLDSVIDGPRWDNATRHRWRFDESPLKPTTDALRAAFASNDTSTEKPRAPIIVATTSADIPLTFVVNGEEVSITTAVSAPIISAVKQALGITKNTGRRPEEWELRHEDGRVIADLSRSAESHSISARSVLYLTLKIGAGGHMWLDPTVERRKFEDEVQLLKRQAGLLATAGALVVRAEKPEIDIVLFPRRPLRIVIPVRRPEPGAPPIFQVADMHALTNRTVGVRFDLTGYDQRAPSLTFRDPLTWAHLPFPLLPACQVVEGGEPPRLAIVAVHPTTQLPFLCIRGLREYHEHPQHDGDQWAMYRSSLNMFALVERVARIVASAEPQLHLPDLTVQIKWAIGAPS